MSVFERYLSIWVALCIVVGIALGQVFPALARAVGAMEVAQVNLPVGVLIWVMIIPMLVRVDFGALGQVRQHVRGIGVTPGGELAGQAVSMASLPGCLCARCLRPGCPPDQLDSYVAGLMLLAAAPHIQPWCLCGAA